MRDINLKVVPVRAVTTFLPDGAADEPCPLADRDRRIGPILGARP